MKSKTTKKSPSRTAIEQRKKLDALIADQGVTFTATFEHLLSTGAELWDDDADFQRFLETVKAVRHEKG